MNILICTGIFPPEAGGPATYTELISTALSEKGHHVAVITYVSQKSKIKNQKSKIIEITRSYFKLWHYWKYFRAARKYGREADIFFAQDPVSAGYPAYLAAKSLKKPFVVKVTGDYSWEQAVNRGLTDKLPDDFPSHVTETLRSPGGRRIKMIRNIQIHVCKSADAVVVPSEYLKKLVTGWGVKEKRIAVIYNAAPAVPEINKDQARKDLGIAQSDFLILSIGRNVPWKGFDLLREVVDELNNFPPLEGEGKGGVKRLRLVTLHNTDRATANKYLRAADLFILNSGYEGFSHVILEAMAARLPVVASRVGGNPELVQDGVNGLLIEFNNNHKLYDAILKLYTNPSLRQHLSESAQSSIAKFSLGEMIDKTLQVLTRMGQNQ